MLRSLTFVFGWLISWPALAQEPMLVRLPADAYSIGIRAGKGSATTTLGKRSIGGWFVSNGALFKKATYPELAPALNGLSAGRGVNVDSPPGFGKLPIELTSVKDGKIVKGMAICPGSFLVCKAGEVEAFDLDDSPRVKR